MNKGPFFVTILFLSLLLVMLPGCSLLSSNHTPQPIISAKQQTALSNTRQVRQLLYQQYNQWKGSKYKIGGLSKKGIDCSGFTHLTYKTKLGINIPRSTKRLSKIGIKIARDKLRVGDLVFFKTGINIRHVGIYLEKGKFLHASTSKGVMISNLKNSYWNKKYWHARRLNS
ncbi:MAG: C40 family peptidase [Pseudomonadales bacterium]|nr:C40 family peptidase [Pseudomonadales bacterium]